MSDKADTEIHLGWLLVSLVSFAGALVTGLYLVWGGHMTMLETTPTGMKLVGISGLLTLAGIISRVKAAGRERGQMADSGGASDR